MVLIVINSSEIFSQTVIKENQCYKINLTEAT